MTEKCQLLLITGVSGSGKTTIGSLAALELGWEFHDGDDFHPPANIAKMSARIPLEDADRTPWLAAVRAGMEVCLREGRGAVFACSALKRSYRSVLLEGLPGAGLVFLQGNRDTLMERMKSRDTHFMKPAMLDSQLAALEPPNMDEALTIEINEPAANIVGKIRRHFEI